MTEPVTAEDQHRALSLINDLKTKVSDVLNHVHGQVKKVDEEEWKTAKGVSFLEVKYQMLLSYCINLTQLMCVKVKGQPITGNPAISRLVEIRTVLEKMRPIDQKLKYQIDKLLKTASTGVMGDNDPLRFKPNPENLQSKIDDSDEEGAETSKIYKPPKLASVAYDGDMTIQEQREKSLKQAKKKALSSNMLRELREEYYDGPEEIKESGDLHRRREDKVGKERTEYEEKYMMRTVVSKKERNLAKKMRTISSLDNITHFGDMSALTGEPSMNDGEPKRKKRKSTPAKKKKSKAKWKRKM